MAKMNINRQYTKIDIEGKEMKMIIDFESSIYYQEQTGENIFVALGKLGNSSNMKTIAYIVASALRDEEDNIVGIDFVKKLDAIKYIGLFSDKIAELIEHSLPAEENQEVVKKNEGKK